MQMFFATIGFITLAGLLGAITGALYFVTRFGGFDLAPLRGKQLAVAVAVWAVVGYLWYLLFALGPFTYGA